MQCFFGIRFSPLPRAILSAVTLSGLPVKSPQRDDADHDQQNCQRKMVRSEQLVAHPFSQAMIASESMPHSNIRGSEDKKQARD